MENQNPRAGQGAGAGVSWEADDQPYTTTPKTWNQLVTAVERAGAELRAETDDDDEIDRLAMIEHRALLRLFAHPAPDAAAVLVKLETLQASRAFKFSEADEIIVALVADARRLLTGGCHDGSL